jgi:hypothetical protein
MWTILLGDLSVDKDKGKYIPVTYHKVRERVGVVGPLTFNSDSRWGGWSTPRLGVVPPGKSFVHIG